MIGKFIWKSFCKQRKEWLENSEFQIAFSQTKISQWFLYFEDWKMCLKMILCLMLLGENNIRNKWKEIEAKK